MNVEINKIFNKNCVCLGIELYWSPFLEIQILFYRYEILITLYKNPPKILQNFKFKGE